ncbi:MAG: asparagine synthase (glutamine-hydrolyzing) [Chitinophagales bacterium]|nr:asparagine synthase (glutamine-hydrolyzing) [Chitinophagales bacterium]
MCGILGTVNVAFEKPLLDLISHRGPDFSDIQHIDLQVGKVIFGHRRLAILDLSEAGNQPMETHDGRFVIIFNGEVYNHLELRTLLDQVQFKSHSDTESILYYFAAFGIEKIRDLNGNFAFALLDKQDQKLYLGRDPNGVKPLYYSIRDKSLIFSSEMRPIVALLKPSLHRQALAALLKLRYNPAEDTLLNEVKKVHPGHYLTINLEDMSIDSHPFITPKTQKKEISFQQAVYQYGDYFERAVRRQLMADVEIGTLLSGGVDSALVTYFATKHSPIKIKSFTVGFSEDDAANELEDARVSAAFLGTDHHEVIINQQDFYDIFESVVRIIEEPLGTTSAIPMYYLNQEVGKHVKVVLTGQGADEPLGGYARYQGELYRMMMPNWMLAGMAPFSRYLRNEKVRRFLQAASITDVVRRFEQTYALFDDATIERLSGLKDTTSYQKIAYYYQLVQGDLLAPIEAMMSIDMHMNLADDLLLYTDKISMHFGVETRVPILDTELIDFIASLPLQYKVSRGEGKHIHKEFARQVLPESIINRPKKGFKSPTSKWFEQDAGERIRQMAEDPSCYFSQLFDRHEVIRILDLHRKGYNQEKQLFLLISLYFWLKNTTL